MLPTKIPTIAARENAANPNSSNSVRMTFFFLLPEYTCTWNIDQYGWYRGYRICICSYLSNRTYCSCIGVSVPINFADAMEVGQLSNREKEQVPNDGNSSPELNRDMVYAKH